jgi:hypothetical protein
MYRKSMPSVATAAVLAAACVASVAALPAAQRSDDVGLSERLDRLQQAGSPRSGGMAKLHGMVHSGHGQLTHWFKDLMPLVDCGGHPDCLAEALKGISPKSDLWTIPRARSLVSLLQGSTVFAADVVCADESAGSFQQALDDMPSSATPLLAVVAAGSPPRRVSGSPWISLSPRAEESLGSLAYLLRAPIQALEARGNLTLALEVDVDDAFFLSGRRSEQVQAIHFVGQGRIVVNPRFAAQLKSKAAAGIGMVPPAPAPGLSQPAHCADLR